MNKDILIVDDEEDIRHLLQEFFKMKGLIQELHGIM